MKYILGIDQSTAGTKAALMDQQGRLSHAVRRRHQQYYPAPGYVEHDAEEIWQNVKALMAEAAQGVDKADIAGVSISNQRETTVIWERATGKPVHRAIVWQDVRAKGLTDSLADRADFVRRTTGLMLSPYFSAAKAAAVLKANPDLMARAQAGELCFGTVDSYLLYRMTDGKSFKTEVSNASRTQLMDLHTLKWSVELADMFGLPMSMLADEICMSDADFGEVTAVESLRGVHVRSMLGDSHAALYGHGCVKPGMVKATYGTGSSIMMNVGDKPVLCEGGLSSSVGFGAKGRVCYVLEGNVTCSADTLMWLKDELQLISSMDDLAEASQVESTGGVYLIPAFAGLGAPWFYENARAMLFGMNRGTRRAHVIRAALESIAHQNADVMDAMGRDANCPVTALEADGGGSVNPLLMQMQSDLVPCKVTVPAEREVSLLGAAMLAGHGTGMLPENVQLPLEAEYTPAMTDEQRQASRAGWLDALKRCR
ncbi:MAG: glycerol kinase GlpK [Clostridia bacterium]|nr:glycerol kinase GlpK [Clostridia bacterium]